MSTECFRNLGSKISVKTVEALGALKLLSGGSVSLAAVVGQRLVASKTWLGSEAVNVLQVLGDLIDLVEQMNLAIAAHKHGPTPPPDNAAQFSDSSASALKMLITLETITI